MKLPPLTDDELTPFLREGTWVATIATQPDGQWIKGLVSRPPASSRHTVTSGSSLSRAASAQPAEPAPITM